MQIAIVGGTGAIGAGLALRWARDTDHAIRVGSREADRAAAAADRYRGRIRARGYDVDVEGAANPAAVDGADVVVVAVPPYSVVDAIDAVADRLADDSTVVTPAVGMRKEDAGMRYHRPDAGSVTALARAVAPSDVPVVGAFHSLPADRLADLDDPLGLDTVVVGDDATARTAVAALAEEIDGLRALDAGPIENAPELESLTPLLINLGRYNEDLHEVGVRFVSR
ncbi:MAG: NADPH-dependent F420 reductase [Halobacteriales archaeon]